VSKQAGGVLSEKLEFYIYKKNAYQQAVEQLVQKKC
jgi:hypothetical protein